MFKEKNVKKNKQQNYLLKKKIEKTQPWNKNIEGIHGTLETVDGRIETLEDRTK